MSTTPSRVQLKYLACASLFCVVWGCYLSRTALHPSKWKKVPRVHCNLVPYRKKVHNGWAKTRKDTEGLFHTPVWLVKSLLLSCLFFLGPPSRPSRPSLWPCTYWSSTSICCALGVHGIQLATFYVQQHSNSREMYFRMKSTGLSGRNASLKTVDSHNNNE